MWRPRPNPLRRVLAGAPLSERLIFTAAIFFALATMGLITDIMTGGEHPTVILVPNVLFAGTIAICYAWTVLVNPLLMLFPIAFHFVYGFWLVDLIPAGPR